MFKIRKTAALAALFCSSALNAWASVDHMVIAMPQIPTIIEPQGINNNAIDRYVGNVFETLLKADQKTGELKPGLAESWRRLSPDTVEFKLRSGVRFHDGTPLTADDVVFTFGPERFSGEKAPGRAVAWEFLGNLKEVVKVDDLTVRVTMKHEGARPDDRAPLLRAHLRDHLRGRLEGCGRLGEVAQGARGHGSLQDRLLQDRQPS